VQKIYDGNVSLKTIETAQREVRFNVLCIQLSSAFQISYILLYYDDYLIGKDTYQWKSGSEMKHLFVAAISNTDKKYILSHLLYFLKFRRRELENVYQKKIYDNLISSALQSVHCLRSTAPDRTA